MIKDEVVSVARSLACVLLLTLTACGFGTKPGPPYDFTQLEPVVDPVLHMPFVSVLSREESGTDCHTQGCGRPRLTYRLRMEPLSNCDRIQELIAAFREVTQRFSVANPGRCGYVGEVDGHSVTIAGHEALATLWPLEGAWTMLCSPFSLTGSVSRQATRAGAPEPNSPPHEVLTLGSALPGRALRFPPRRGRRPVAGDRLTAADVGHGQPLILLVAAPAPWTATNASGGRLLGSSLDGD